MSMAWICYKKYGLFFFERVHSMGFILFEPYGQKIGYFIFTRKNRAILEKFTGKK